MPTTHEQFLPAATIAFAAAGRPDISAYAVHYETIAISRAGTTVGPAFADVHAHSTAAVARLVAGYLGVESRADGAIDITSHGRVAATITWDESSLSVVRASDAAWPDAGIAVLGSGRGQVERRSENEVIVTGDEVVTYLVHGPSADKVDARIADLRARAAIFGHPLPTERA